MTSIGDSGVPTSYVTQKNVNDKKDSSKVSKKPLDESIDNIGKETDLVSSTKASDKKVNAKKEVVGEVSKEKTIAKSTLPKHSNSSRLDTSHPANSADKSINDGHSLLNHTQSISKSSKRLHRLSQSTMDCVLPLLTTANLATMAKPQAGKTASNIHLTSVKVLEDDLPIVIRVTKDNTYFQIISAKRDRARELIVDNGFNHLVVPRTNITENGFMIEERLPYIKIYPTGPMAFYYKNQSSFDEAAVEFASFLSQIYLGDLINGGNFDGLWKNGDLRYDNLVIYQDQGVGKIGLIDLDHLRTKIDLSTKKDYIEGAITAISFFPYQYDAIVDSFKGKCEFTNEDLDLLKSQQDESLQALEAAVGNHYKYLEDNQIALTESHVGKKISELNLDQLANELEESFKSTGDHNYFFGRVDTIIAKNRQLFREVSLPRLLRYIEQNVNSILETLDKDSEFEILGKRKLLFSLNNHPIAYSEYLEELGIQLKRQEERIEEDGRVISQLSKKLIEKGVFGQGPKYRTYTPDTDVELIF